MSDAAAAMVVGQAMHSGGIEPEEVIAARQLQHNADVVLIISSQSPHQTAIVLIAAIERIQKVVNVCLAM